jgi:hypothetical protein
MLKKLHCIVLEVSTCHFRTVPAQAQPKMRARPCSPPCRDPEHGTALVFVSCWHGLKYFVSCRASSHAKRPYHDSPSNGTAKFQLYLGTHTSIVNIVLYLQLALHFKRHGKFLYAMHGGCCGVPRLRRRRLVSRDCHFLRRSRRVRHDG